MNDPELSGQRAKLDNSPMLSQERTREYWLNLKTCPECGQERIYFYSIVKTTNTLEDIGDIIACNTLGCEFAHIVWRPGYE